MQIFHNGNIHIKKMINAHANASSLNIIRLTETAAA